MGAFLDTNKKLETEMECEIARRECGYHSIY